MTEWHSEDPPAAGWYPIKGERAGYASFWNGEHFSIGVRLDSNSTDAYRWSTRMRGYCGQLPADTYHWAERPMTWPDPMMWPGPIGVEEWPT